MSDRKYIGISGANRSEPGTYEAACRWLDNESPGKAAALIGFEQQHPATAPSRISIVEVRHTSYESGCAPRPRNYLDLPREWQDCKSMTAPALLWEIKEHRLGFQEWYTSKVEDAVDALYRLGEGFVKCLTPESERVLFAEMASPPMDVEGANLIAQNREWRRQKRQS